MMHRFAVRLAVIATLIIMGSTLVWAQYGGGGGAAPAAPPNGVNIYNFEFNPTPMTVKVGTKVTWKNLDGAAHAVASRESGLFDTGDLALNQEGSYTFEKAGNFDYFCKIHPSMEGRIIVEGGNE